MVGVPQTDFKLDHYSDRASGGGGGDYDDEDGTLTWSCVRMMVSGNTKNVMYGT